jgi:hypothetical protein
VVRNWRIGGSRESMAGSGRDTLRALNKRGRSEVKLEERN